MSFRHSITIVASPRPRVGKTLVARLLTEFHRHEGRPVTAFDLNSGEGTLAQFLPEYAKISEIGDIKGQMALFDRLIADDGATKIVDLGHQAFETFVTVASRIGFATEARRRGITPAHFSFNVEAGRCPECTGTGVLEVDMQFMAPVVVVKTCVFMVGR